MIECEGLTKRFGHFTAVDHVSFKVAKGSIFGFLGPNGSGKSTVIRMLVRPARSRARAGRASRASTWREADRGDQEPHRLHVAEVFALRRVDGAREPQFYGRLYGLRGAALKQRRDELVALTHLEPYLDRRAGVALRRLAAAAGDGLLAHAQAERAVPRRTDGGH